MCTVMIHEIRQGMTGELEAEQFSELIQVRTSQRGESLISTLGTQGRPQENHTLVESLN